MNIKFEDIKKVDRNFDDNNVPKRGRMVILPNRSYTIAKFMKTTLRKRKSMFTK